MTALFAGLGILALVAAGVLLVGFHSKVTKGAIIAPIIIGVALIIFSGSFVIVPTGYVGVKSMFGQISNKVAHVGFNLKVPVVQEIQLVNTKQSDVTVQTRVWGESSEKTPVYAENIIVTYKVNGIKASWICANVSEGAENLITPSLVASAVKNAMVQLDADHVTIRSAVEPLVLEQLKVSVSDKYGNDVIDILKVVIDQMDFEDSYNEAIAAKSIARQNQEKQNIENATAVAKAESDKKVAIANAEAAAESAKIKAEADANVAKIAAEAEADVIKTKADAQAEANKKLAQSLTDEVLKSQFYGAWDGKLPEVMSDGTVITNLGN